MQCVLFKRSEGPSTHPKRNCSPKISNCKMVLKRQGTDRCKCHPDMGSGTGGATSPKENSAGKRQGKSTPKKLRPMGFLLAPRVKRRFRPRRSPAPGKRAKTNGREKASPFGLDDGFPAPREHGVPLHISRNNPNAFQTEGYKPRQTYPSVFQTKGYSPPTMETAPWTTRFHL